MTEQELQPIIDHIRASGVVDPCSLFAPCPQNGPTLCPHTHTKIPQMQKPFRTFTPTGQVLNSHDYIHVIFETKSRARYLRSLGARG